MKLFGFELGRIKAQLPQAVQSLNTFFPNGGFFQFIRESYSGAFQQNVVIDGPKDLLSFSGIFAPLTLIANDIAKLRVKLVAEGDDDICAEVKQSPFLPVLNRPNHYQNRIQFWAMWIITKLLWGNVYVLKVREPGRRIVRQLYILDPARVKPLVTSEGDVYYELSMDQLNRVGGTIVVPASEMIHDRMNCLFHPLIGVSPIYACALSATMGRKIQNNSTLFFGNSSRPSGILVTPSSISDEDALKMKNRWEENYGGANTGRTAVLGNGLKYESISAAAEQSQLIEQLDWTKFDCADVFHVPQFKVGGDVPSGATIESLNLMYYSDCLQSLIEAAELCMDEGIELPAGNYVEFDLDGLLRMDQSAQMKLLTDGVKGVLKIDEARRKLNLPGVAGGNVVYLQQQNFSTEALAKRDASADPFKTSAPAAPKPATQQGDGEGDAQQLAQYFIRGMEADRAES